MNKDKAVFDYTSNNEGECFVGTLMGVLLVPCSPTKAARIIHPCVVLHNLAIEMGDDGDGFDAGDVANPPW